MDLNQVMSVFLQDLEIRFNDYLLANAEQIIEQTSLFLDQQKRQVGKKIREPVFWFTPCLISQEDENRITHHGQNILSALRKVIPHIASDKSIMKDLGLSREEMEHLVLNAKEKHPLSCVRFDAFLHDGVVKFIEVNGSAPNGMSWIESMKPTFNKLPYKSYYNNILTFKEYNMDRVVVESIHRNWLSTTGNNRRPNIFIAADPTHASIQSEILLIKESFEKLNYASRAGDVRDLNYEGGVLRYNSFPIDVVYRKFDLDWFLKHRGYCEALDRAYRSRDVYIVNPWCDSVITYKSLFTLLKDGTFDELFSNKEIQSIQETIPWTKNINKYLATPAFVRYINDNKENLVLKPADGTEGNSVVIGHKTTQESWDTMLQNIAESSDMWVAQEYIAAPQKEIVVYDDGSLKRECVYYDLGPHFINNSYVCSQSRFGSQPGILNFHAGNHFNLVYTVIPK